MASCEMNRIRGAKTTTKKEKYLHIPKTLKEGWAEVTRSTPSSPDISKRSSPFRTANELSRSVNFLASVHQNQVDSSRSISSGSSVEEIPSAENWEAGQNRKSSLQDPPKMLLPDEFRPRRSSMSRLFDSANSRSQHSSVGNLLTAVLSKTLRKKYVCLRYLSDELRTVSLVFGFSNLSP